MVIIKKHIKNFARLTIVFCFAVVALTACGDGDEEILDNVPVEEMTDEEDEKKSKLKRN